MKIKSTNEIGKDIVEASKLEDIILEISDGAAVEISKFAWIGIHDVLRSGRLIQEANGKEYFWGTT
jgi:hypothetical protein